jgi:4-amino-4-deoxy-L-arabinose transferase-like glycosyltransferase
VLGIIMAAAVFFRFTQLDSVPPGMTHDEAAFGAEAERILAGERPIYFALGYGHEPLYAYLVSITFSLLGHTLTALRVTSAVCGLLVVLGTYLLARRMFGVRVAWISAAWMAVAFWPLSLSRQALRAITLPMLWLPAAWWFWRGLGEPGRGSEVQPRPPDGDTESLSPRPGMANWILSGLFLGASFYTYMASRVTWVVFPLYGLYLLLLRGTRRILKRAWLGLLVALSIAGLAALPLFLYLHAHPESEKRVGAMMAPIQELLAGQPDRVLRHTWDALRVFSWSGDQFWAYNIPGRPVLNWAGSLCFYGGLLAALWRWRDPSRAFVLLWLAVGMLPAMVTTDEGIFLRAIVAQPATYVLVALGLEAARSGLQAAGSRLKMGRWRWAAPPQPWGQVAWWSLVVGLTAMEGARTYQGYFVDWPSYPEARTIYNHNLVASARYLSERGEQGPAGISALWPLYYHDPWIWRYVTGHNDPEVRWFDGRGGIVYPGSGEAQYVFSASTLLDPALWSEFEPHATLVERHELDAQDENPYFEIWRWQGEDALQARLAELGATTEMWASPEIQFTQPALRQSLKSPVPFGDVMALIGYRLNGQAFEPGDVVELVTYWRALRTVEAEDDWKSFVHLLDRDSREQGNRDTLLPCPPTGWLPGDVIVLVHRFSVAGGAGRDQEAYLEVGVYRSSAGRLPVLADGALAGDRVLLAPVHIQ